MPKINVAGTQLSCHWAIDSVIHFVSAAIVMLKNRLILSAVTGGISFGLSLLILRDFKMASYTGLMGLVASQAAVLVTSNQHEAGLHERREELHGHIRALQRRRSLVYEELTLLQSQQAELSTRVPQTMTSQAVSTVRSEASSQNPWVQSTQTPQHVSWNLTEPRRSITDMEMDNLNDRIAHLSQEEAELQQSLHHTLSSKQQTERSLTIREAELKQLEAEISEQEALKQTLNQTILELEQDQNQLQVNIPQLKQQIQALEAQRNQIGTDIQSQQQQKTETGATALQGAIDQMQAQIEALRDELGSLETQIIERRNEKLLLDQTIEQLQRDRSKLHPEPASTSPSKAKSPSKADSDTRLPTVSQPKSATELTPTVAHDHAERTVTKSKSKEKKRTRKRQPAPANQPNPTTSNQSGLPTEWVTFKGKLQPYEFQALCAIALEENPTGVLKQLAENNLTMPEMLIDTINEQALDAIGDLILEAGHDAASTIIAQEYRDEVATLIATHR